MRPPEFFRFCPRCGAPQAAVRAGIRFSCAACGFLLYFNPTVSAGAFLRRADGRVLWLQRAKEPGKGKLGLPGGFIDFGETAEAALVREVREEVGLEIRTPRFLCSLPNEYPYAGVTYAVLDLIFAADIDGSSPAAAADEVEALVWLRPEETNPDEIAFSSVRTALGVYLRAARPVGA